MTNKIKHFIINKKIILIFLVISLISLFTFKKYIPENYKNFIREYIFVYSNINNLKLEVNKLKKLNEYLDNEISENIRIIFLFMIKCLILFVKT